MARRQTLIVRDLTEEERTTLEIYAKSHGYQPFSERRSRIILASNEGKSPLQIAADFRVDDETVRRAIRAFNEHGTIALVEGSPKPKHTGDLFLPGGRDKLIDIFRRTPKDYGHNTVEWTLELIADAAFADGLTRTRVSDETIRLALIRQHIKWGVFKRFLRRERRNIPPPYHRMIATQ